MKNKNDNDDCFVYVKYSIVFHAVVLALFAVVAYITPSRVIPENTIDVEFFVDASKVGQNINIPKSKPKDDKKDEKKDENKDKTNPENKYVNEQKIEEKILKNQSQEDDKIDPDKILINQNNKKIDNDFNMLCKNISQKELEKQKKEKIRREKIAAKQKAEKIAKEKAEKEKIEKERIEKENAEKLAKEAKIKAEKDKKDKEKREKAEKEEKEKLQHTIDGNDSGELEATEEIITINYIMQSIYPYWSAPAGLKNYENLIIEIEVALINGVKIEASSIKILNKTQYNNDSSFRIMADSAIRAITQACPIILPKRVGFGSAVLRFSPKNIME